VAVTLAPTWTRRRWVSAMMPMIIGGARWSDRYRFLGDDENVNAPGPWRSKPWQREILDSLTDPTVDWLVIQKAAQMGVSELIRCAIGCWAEEEPGDVLWVMATAAAAKKAMKKLQKMFANTPRLRGRVSERGRDSTLLEMVLRNGMRIVIGWALSPQSLASDPFRYVVLDETGLYPQRVGKEGSPLRLAEERMKTFGRRAKCVLLSKPSHADDLICTQYEECLDKREYRVPCPHCSHLQSLTWEQVRWEGGRAASAPSEPSDRVRKAAEIEAAQSAWVQCLKCAGKIEDTHGAMTDERAGWHLLDAEVRTRRRAYHISELYHWAKSISDLVARFLRCTKPADIQEFWAGSLGLAYVATRGEVDAALFARRAVGPAGVVPSWATTVLATADTQIDHFFYMVRAWGNERQTKLIDFGRADSFEDLELATINARYPFDRGDREAVPTFLLIDSAGGTAGGALDTSRTAQVYRWAADKPNVIVLKGDMERPANQGRPLGWTETTIGGGSKGRKVTFDLCRPNANWFKNQLVASIKQTDPIIWMECEGAESPEYGRHMTGQKLIREEDTKGRVKWLWKKSRGMPDHYFDCAYMQIVASEIAIAEKRRTLVSQQRPSEKRKSEGRFRPPHGGKFLSHRRK